MTIVRGIEVHVILDAWLVELRSSSILDLELNKHAIPPI